MSTQVPNTTTFSLQNVVDVVQPSSNNLLTCINEAHPNGWDTNYSGAKNSLYNFRNYQRVDSVGLTGMTVSFVNGAPINLTLETRNHWFQTNSTNYSFEWVIKSSGNIYNDWFKFEHKIDNNSWSHIGWVWSENFGTFINNITTNVSGWLYVRIIY
jgi:hypothetical protein